MNKIFNYDEECYRYCKENNIELEDFTERFHKGFDSNFHGGKLLATTNDDSFGFLNDSCRYEIKVNKDDNCIDISTCMTNFDMGVWLETIGVRNSSINL